MNGKKIICTNKEYEYLEENSIKHSKQKSININEKLNLEINMVYDLEKNEWIQKTTIISVYLNTKNRPSFNQLVGRINIDLSQVCEQNSY
jgi:hypothetical protein